LRGLLLSTRSAGRRGRRDLGPDAVVPGVAGNEIELACTGVAPASWRAYALSLSSKPDAAAFLAEVHEDPAALLRDQLHGEMELRRQPR